MAVLGSFLPKSKQKPIVTSRPIFQHASSFLRDDDEEGDLKKSVPLPLFHQRQGQYVHEYPPQPKSQTRLNLILHILNATFTTISLGLFVTVIPMWNANFHHARSIIAGDYTDGLVLVPLLISLLSSTYLLMTEHTPLRDHVRPRFRSSKRRSNESMIPAKPFALLSFTILLTLLVALTLSATNSIALSWQAPQRSKNGLVICNISNIFSRQCQPTLYLIGGLEIGGVVMGGLAWCIWAMLFIVTIRQILRQKRERERLSRERRQRRREERRNRRGREHLETGRDQKHEAFVSKADMAIIRQDKNPPRPRETIQQWMNSRYA